MSETEEQPQLQNSDVQPELKHEPVTDADPEVVDEPQEIRPTEAETPPPPPSPAEQEVSQQPELRKDDEGNRTFSMRELLNELKKEDDGGGAEVSEGEYRQSLHDSDGGGKIETSTPYSQESTQQRHIDQSDAAMDLINGVTGVDEEGRSRQRILTFAARRYASAIERNPEDYDALYNWALVLQRASISVQLQIVHGKY